MTNAKEERSFLSLFYTDLVFFFRHAFCLDYVPKNNYSYHQKRKILSYLYFRNQGDIKFKKSRSFNEKVLSEFMNKEQITNHLRHLEEVEKYNRIFLISSVYETQKKIGKVGNLDF